MTENVTLAQFLAAFCGADVEPSPQAQEILQLCLYDWAVCGLAGAGEQVSRITRDLAQAEAGVPEATVIGAGDALPARVAALVNGTTSHALDYDDTHFAHIGHPSVAVIPAALAVAQAQGRNMDEFRRAALLGIEASIRAGVWLGRSHYQAGFHQTGTAGAIGATLASARLMGLAESDAAMAFGIIGTRASGLKSQFGTMGKPYNAGIAASNGVEAAALAGRGFSSSVYGLDGDQGFCATHQGEGNEAAFDGLGQDWMIETISHKFHACCHGLHAMLEAISGMELPKGEVGRVVVTTHPRWSTVCNIAEPKTGLEAKFSYRLTAAMMLCGEPTAALHSYSMETAMAGEITRVRDRVEVVFDPDIGETVSAVRIEIGDQVVEASHDLSTPMAIEVRSDRLRAKGDALLGPNLSRAIWDGARSDDLRAFTDILRMS